MATAPTMTSDVKKLSFAKVAASASREAMLNNLSARTPNPVAARDRQETRPAQPTSAPVNAYPSAAPAPPTAMGEPLDGTPPLGAYGSQASEITDSLKDLRLQTTVMPSLVVNGTESATTETSSKTYSQTPSDDFSQKGDSNSDLGTKPPSLDGKSITSGTTFNALDEKESLRPDDSASVKAAEDDDAFSVRGSLMAGSRVGSEVAGKVHVHRIQLGDMPPRTITSHVVSEPQIQGVATPQSGSSEQQPVTDAKIALVAATSTPDGLYGQNPDEKLLEAMKSSKDRLFLLRLEKQVMEFVQDSKEPFMDLPPCNSFCRMLTHKLADYYHMTHSFEVVAGAVRIYRTPFCRVPPSLASLATATPTSSTPPPAVLPRKIMRRGEDGEFATASASPSKPTSEAGSDGKDKGAPTKEKLSREEREEAYKQARERIFGNTTEVSTPENDDGTGISRASSVSTRDRSNLSKSRKKRRDDSESFDSRSQYTPFYGHPQQPTWMSPQYLPMNNTQYNGQAPQQYSSTVQPAYGSPSQTYPQMMPNSGYAPQYGGVPNYPAQPSAPQYQTPAAPMPGYVPPIQTTPPQQHGWQPQNFSQSPYPSGASPGAPGAPGIPYAYGQLPAHLNPKDPKSQHPIPGSYNRHAFNPQTQSFVPGGGMPPMQAPVQPAVGSYNGFSSQQGKAQASPPHMGYSNYQQPISQQRINQQPINQQPINQPPINQLPMNQLPYRGNANGFGMMRQGSNNSLPPYHTQPPPSQRPVQNGPHAQQTGSQLAQNPSSHIPSKPVVPQGPTIGGQTYNHLPNYGNPATLPQKPST